MSAVVAHSDSTWSTLVSIALFTKPGNLPSGNVKKASLWSKELKRLPLRGYALKKMGMQFFQKPKILLFCKPRSCLLCVKECATGALQNYFKLIVPFIWFKEHNNWLYFDSLIKPLQSHIRPEMKPKWTHRNIANVVLLHSPSYGCEMTKKRIDVNWLR